MLGSAIRILVVLAAAAAAGFSYAVGYHGLDALGSRAKYDDNQKLRQTLAIDLDGLRRHYESGLLVIDTRSAADFKAERLAAPFILNVYPGDVAKNLKVLGSPMFAGQPVVLYCNEARCDLAEHVYEELAPLGLFSEIRIYLDGWFGIKQAGLPTTTDPPVDLAALVESAEGAGPLDLGADPVPPDDAAPPEPAEGG